MFSGRRLRFAILVLTAQLLLIGMTIAWLIHMILIARYGAVYFVEENPLVLYTEIAAATLIVVFAIIVFVNQWKRLGERRQDDQRRERVESRTVDS